jgi:hypothetical protein
MTNSVRQAPTANLSRYLAGARGAYRSWPPRRQGACEWTAEKTAGVLGGAADLTGLQLSCYPNVKGCGWPTSRVGGSRSTRLRASTSMTKQIRHLARELAKENLRCASRCRYTLAGDIVMDVWSRRVVGRRVSEHESVELVAGLVPVTRFVTWCTGVHRHSGIRYVTPDARHYGKEPGFLPRRQGLYEPARLHPNSDGPSSFAASLNVTTCPAAPRKHSESSARPAVFPWRVTDHSAHLFELIDGHVERDRSPSPLTTGGGLCPFGTCMPQPLSRGPHPRGRVMRALTLPAPSASLRWVLRRRRGTSSRQPRA